MGTTHHPWFYRLLLPLLLALLLGSLVQAQETPILTIFCQVEPNTVASTGTAQFTLRLRNIQPGLDLSQLSVNVDVTNPALIISSAINTAPPDPLLSLDFSQTVLSPTQIQIRASRVGIDTISGVEGGLAAIDLQTAQESGLVGFTLSAASLKRPDGSEIPVRADTPRHWGRRTANRDIDTCGNIDTYADLDCEFADCHAYRDSNRDIAPHSDRNALFDADGD